MAEPELYKVFIEAFNKLGLRYMLTGAAASIVYGEPRLTNDIDVVLDLAPAEVETFFDSFPLEKFYCPPSEVILVEIARSHRGHFNLIHHETGFKADIYTAGRDQLNKWGLDNRKLINIEKDKLWLAPIEYVILRKLEYYREGQSEKHIRDIAGILSISSDQIEFNVLNEKIKVLRLEMEWSEAKRNWSQ
jgi:hypothetical protein